MQLPFNGQLKLPFVIYSNIQLTFFSNTRNLMISSVLNFVRERDHFSVVRWQNSPLLFKTKKKQNVAKKTGDHDSCTWTFVLKIAVSENNDKFARSCPF